MSRRASNLLTKWTLASLLTGLMLSTSPVEAKSPAWSTTNRTRYDNARTTQYKSQQQAQSYRDLSRRQYATYKKTGNEKQLTWSQNNRVRAAQSKIRSMKAESRRLESLAVVAGKTGNQDRAASLRAQASKINGRVDRLGKAVSRYVVHHGLTGRVAKTASAGRGSPTFGSSAMSSTGGQAGPKFSTQQLAAKRGFGREYNTHRQTYEARMSRSNQMQAQAYETGDAGLLRSAVAQKALAARAQVKMWKSQANGLRAKGERNPARAAEYSARADKLDARAASRGEAIKRYVSRYGSMIPKNAPQQVMDGEPAPGVDGAAQAQVRAMASRKGKQTAKIQLKNGNLSGAVGTLRAMEAQGNRRSVMGLVDRYRKWSTKRQINKTSYKAGKSAARSGDFELAQEALGALEATGKQGSWKTSRQFRGIATQAIKGAKSAAKDHRGAEAYQLLDFAKQIRAYSAEAKPTKAELLMGGPARARIALRHRWVRRTAKGRVWKDAQRFAKEGNMDAFRTSMKLASAYAREDGKPMATKKNLQRTRKLYNTAVKASVVRALDDAKNLVSGRLGYVSVEEAAKRLAYAEHTAESLAQKGVTVRYGLFRRNVGGKFADVRKLLVKAWGAQNGGAHQVKPGLLKRVFEKWFKQEHRRTPPPVAAVDSGWERKMMRAQQAQQEQASMEQGLTPEMMAELQAQMGGGRQVTPAMQRQGINE